MIDRRAQRDSSISIFRIIAVACAICVLVYFIFALVTGIEPIATVIACALLCIFLCIFIFLTLNPDSVRSQYTEETLSVASAMLEDLKGGLTQESARLVCRRILPETRHDGAITDEDNVLACAGEFEENCCPIPHPHACHTLRYRTRHRAVVQPHGGVVGSDGSHNQVPAGIIAPIKVGDRTVGTLKFYYKTPRAVDRTQYALCLGLCRDPVHAARHPRARGAKELTARAEVRALQAQINPHFLFNTLNTIASFTRTDPLRARELLREFSSFYRATLDNSGSLIPVSREVTQTKRYLTFEKARFGEDRVLATFHVSEDVEDTLVPAFVIQPIVENAVRHGMGDDEALKIDVTWTTWRRRDSNRRCR
ncbi:MAG: sensor histidine kinase [Collinsella sp.]